MKNPFLTTKYGYCFVFLYVRERMKARTVVLQRFISDKSRYAMISRESPREMPKLATEPSKELISFAD